jgi:hypothetical protein
MTAPEPVSTPDDLRPGLETYPRLAVVAFLCGPLILAGYTTTGVGWVVTGIGGIAGLAASQVLARDMLVRFFTTGPGGPRRRRTD